MVRTDPIKNRSKYKDIKKSMSGKHYMGIGILIIISIAIIGGLIYVAFNEEGQSGKGTSGSSNNKLSKQETEAISSAKEWLGMSDEERKGLVGMHENYRIVKEKEVLDDDRWDSNVDDWRQTTKEGFKSQIKENRPGVIIVMADLKEEYWDFDDPETNNASLVFLVKDSNVILSINLFD